MLCVTGLEKSYGTLSTLNGIDFTVGDGEIVSLIGPSGCGKSTLLNIISGLGRPDNGTVRRKSNAIGYIFQDDRLLPWRTVYDNIRLVRDEEDAAEIKHLLEIVELSDFAGYYPAQLSGGMCKRCGIARAFYCKSGLLLLDEPFQALDIRLKAEMHALLLKVWREKRQSMLFVTHDIDEALAVSNRILVLSARPSVILKTFHVSKKDEKGFNGQNLQNIRREIADLLHNEEPMKEEVYGIF